MPHMDSYLRSLRVAWVAEERDRILAELVGCEVRYGATDDYLVRLARVTDIVKDIE